MLRLLRKDVVPQDGWAYTQEPSGTVIKGKSWNELLTRVRNFRIANGIAVERNFEDALGTEVCLQQGWGSPVCMHAEPPPTKERKIGMHDIVNFLKVLKHWLLNNPTLVDDGEANRRAGICSQCPHNVNVYGCMGCTNIAGLIFNVVQDRKTEYDTSLRNCQICGCVNKAQVWVPRETLDQGVNPTMRSEFPEWCWKK